MVVKMSFGRKNRTLNTRTHVPLPDEALRLRNQLVPSVIEDFDNNPQMPKHASIPDMPQSQGEFSSVFLECSIFLYSVLALFLQYLNLYKTLWWLPHSHTQHSMKFHLIDPFLLSVIGLILGRRVTFFFLKKLSLAPPGFTLPPYLQVMEFLLKGVLVLVILSSFLFSLSQVLTSYSWVSTLFLVYPGAAIRLLHLCYYNGDSNNGNINSGAGHACSMSPNHIREEVDLLQVDVYQKIRQGIFTSFISAYYAVFVPCCFTPATLYIDWFWVFEQCLIVFLTSLLLQLSYLFPLHHCDLLHKSSMHLGAWKKLDNTRVLSYGSNYPSVPTPRWSENDLWVGGSLVKHGRSLYEGTGVSIAAEPGNGDHERFYFLFHDPMRVINGLCLLDAYMIAMQFCMLIHSVDWQHIMTLVLLMFTNYLLLFKMFKDKIIMGRIYHPILAKAD